MAHCDPAARVERSSKHTIRSFGGSLVVRRSATVLAVAGLTVLGLAVGAAGASASTFTAQDRAALDRLERVAATVAFHAKTGKVRFVGTTAGRPIARPAGFGPGASPVAVARAFLAPHARLFGLSDQARDLRVARVQEAPAGRAVVRFQQTHGGVPVLAGDLVVNLDAQRNVLSVGGETSPALRLDAVAQVSAGHAVATARWLTGQKSGVAKRALRASRPALWIYDSELMGTPGERERVLVWRIEVTAPARGDVRRLVLIDARTGDVTLSFDQIAHAKNRKICDAGNAKARVPCQAPFKRVEGQRPISGAGAADVNDAYLYSGIVYDFFKSRFNRDSIDNRGMPLIQTVRYCESGCPFENAFWNGTQMVYGPNYASAGDVVGHEMAHGITERTSGLFYWFQAGAINESMSDVFGELVDLTDGRGNDSAGAKWLMGEDLPIGAIRNMKNPPAFEHPDRMTSPFYFEGLDEDFAIDDSGGVHYNSGVNNKAAYLLTDGGSFNGRTVSALGLAKVARLYYEVNSNILTSGSDYADLYDALIQACQNLVGSAGFTQSNCNEVADAVAATEMHLQPMPDSQFPNVADAPVCDPGQVPTDLFYDNFEQTPNSNWASGALVGVNQWGLLSDYSSSGNLAMYGPDQTSQSDTWIQSATGTTVPVGSATYARFSHVFDFEFFFDWFNFVFVNADGGVVEYSTDGGTTWLDAETQSPAPNGLFDWDGYNIAGTEIYNGTGGDNPLRPRRAFTTANGGMRAARLNLTPLAGQNVKLRFRIGTDTNNVEGFFFGWIIDDVRIYTCAPGSRPTGSPTTNFLRNASFEWDDNDDAMPDFWSMNQNALRLQAAKKTGKYGLRHKAINRSGSVDNEAYATTQKVTGLAGGQAYRASAWIRIPTTGAAVNFAYQVQFLNASGGVIQTKVVKQYTNDTAGAWKNPALTMTSPAGTSAAKVSMVQKGLNATVLAEDIVFKRL